MVLCVRALHTVAPAAAAAWVAQEWAIHRFLLHSEGDWLGALRLLAGAGVEQPDGTA